MKSSNRNLQYAYPTEDGQLSVPVLKGVNLSIRRGEFVAVLGHNGSGKSTLAGCFNAIRLPTGGVCYVDMMDTRDENNTYESARLFRWCSRIRTTSLSPPLLKKMSHLRWRTWACLPRNPQAR